MADIHVMSGGAPKEVLAALVPEFEKKTGHKVHITYIVISAMQQKLAAGEKPDMVLMPVPAIEARVKDGSFRGDAWATLGIVSVGLVVREGAAKPDISTLETFQAGDARREVGRARQSGRDAERRASGEGVGATRHRGRDEAEADLPQCARWRRRGDPQGRGRGRALSAERNHLREGRDRRRPDPGGGAAQHRLWRGRAHRQCGTRACHRVREIPRRSGERARTGRTRASSRRIEP